VQLFRESQREWATSLLATSAARDILYKFAMHGPFGHHSNVDELLHCWRYDRDLFIRVAVKSEAMYALTEKGMLAFAYMDGFETFNAASAYWRLHEYFSKKEKEAVEAYKLKNG
jgi:hypothetical protein